MSERRMFSLEEDEDQSHGSAYKSRFPREKRFRSRFDQVISLYHDELLLNVNFKMKMTSRELFLLGVVGHIHQPNFFPLPG